MKRPPIKSLLAGLASAGALALAACGTATPYQPLTTSGASTGGYAEYQISKDRFRVSFQGNTLTERDTVERYLLFRAAELTSQQGFDWFTLIDRDTERQTQTYTVPRSETYWAWNPIWYQRTDGRWAVIPNYSPVWGTRYDVEQSDRYMASAEIFLGAGPKPQNDPRAFDAKEVIANLSPGILRPTVTG